MILYHTTTQSAWSSIEAEGLKTSRSQGKEPVIWLHTKSKVYWAITHVQSRHGASLDQVVVLQVHVPRSWLKRAWKGLWKCSQDVLVRMIKLKTTGLSFAASPIE